MHEDNRPFKKNNKVEIIDKLSDILKDFEQGKISADNAEYHIMGLFRDSKNDLCEPCQKYWIGHNEQKQRYCISCKSPINNQ